MVNWIVVCLHVIYTGLDQAQAARRGFFEEVFIFFAISLENRVLPIKLGVVPSLRIV